jgi:hypothetical protein
MTVKKKTDFIIRTFCDSWELKIHTVKILIMHGSRLELMWDIMIYACILVSHNAYQPMHNLAEDALSDVLVPTISDVQCPASSHGPSQAKPF